ncbi:hypothetical protein GOP47_0026508 [Adiantum capillus-veneris]|nr:hypothetical protein GOP47_0026508 [Adiantum capillus-veneris]
MAQIGPAGCNIATSPSDEGQHPPPHEQQQPPAISQWEILKHAEEMMKMMMAAGGGSQSDPSPQMPRISGRGCHTEGAIHQSERPYEVIPRVTFLDNCFFCKRRLKHERDIFIYRGDAAFCTEECRQRQILKDESHAMGASNKKESATSETAVAA